MKKQITITLGLSMLLMSGAAFACDMEGSGHQEATATHHEISLIPQAQANEAATGTKRAAFQVKGMMCSSCYNKVNGALSQLPGVKEVKIDSKKNIVTVAYQPEQTNTDAMLKAVDSVGFKATMKN